MCVYVCVCVCEGGEGVQGSWLQYVTLPSSHNAVATTVAYLFSYSVVFSPQANYLIFILIRPVVEGNKERSRYMNKGRNWKEGNNSYLAKELRTFPRNNHDTQSGIDTRLTEEGLQDGHSVPVPRNSTMGADFRIL
jgi:hypothetical protein